jgi:hypothetical protein
MATGPSESGGCKSPEPYRRRLHGYIAKAKKPVEHGAGTAMPCPYEDYSRVVAATWWAADLDLRRRADMAESSAGRK